MLPAVPLHRFSGGRHVLRVTALRAPSVKAQ
jgi:hypothetical protein